MARGWTTCGQTGNAGFPCETRRRLRVGGPRPALRASVTRSAADEEAAQHRLVQGHLHRLAVLQVHGLGEGGLPPDVLEPVGDLVVGADVAVAGEDVRATHHLAAGDLLGGIGCPDETKGGSDEHNTDLSKRATQPEFWPLL